MPTLMPSGNAHSSCKIEKWNTHRHRHRHTPHHMNTHITEEDTTEMSKSDACVMVAGWLLWLAFGQDNRGDESQKTREGGREGGRDSKGERIGVEKEGERERA